MGGQDLTSHLTEAELIDMILKRSPGSEDRSVLDFGCGDGVYMDIFQARGGCQVLGLDVEESYRRENVVITSDSLSYLNSCNQTFDIIFARESIYYLQSNQQNMLLGAMTKILKPGGVLCVICYNGILDTASFIRQKDQFMQTTHNEISLRACLDSVFFDEVLIYGIKPQARRRVGRLAIFLLEKLVTIKYKSRFLLERRRSESNPSLFSPRIALFAVRNLTN